MLFSSNIEPDETLEKMQDYINLWFLERKVYKTAIQNLRESNKLKDTCINELEQYLTDEEYNDYTTNYIEEAESEGIRTVVIPREASDEQIAVEAKILLSLLKEDLYSDEIGEMLNFSVPNVEMALQKYKKKGSNDDGKTE